MTMRQEEYVPPSFRAHAVLIEALRSPLASRSQAVTGTPSVSVFSQPASVFHLFSSPAAIGQYK